MSLKSKDVLRVGAGVFLAGVGINILSNIVNPTAGAVSSIINNPALAN